MRRLWVLAAMAAGCTFVHAQCTPSPCITLLQSGLAGGAATNGAAITAGTSAGNGVWLFISGVFPVGQIQPTVKWTSNAAPAGQTLTLASQSAVQLVAVVPPSLFAAAGSATVTVTGYIIGLGNVTSNPATFTVNPAMTAAAALPAGTVGQSYSQPLSNGGTGPFTILSAGGTLPPGMTSSYQADPNTNLTGTPATAAAYTFTMYIRDSWQNTLTHTYSLTINPQFPTPSLTNLIPASCTVSTNATAGCTTGAFPLQVIGTNFSAGLGVNWDTYGFSAATVNGQTAASISVPHSLMTVGSHSVSVVLNDVFSNSLVFVVNPAPVPGGLQPSSVTAGAQAFSMTVTGANFLAGTTVQWQGASGTTRLVPTTLNATQLTVTVPATLVAAAGSATVSVLSPDTVPVASNSLTFTVNAALSITTTSPLASGQVGVAYPGVQFQASGGAGAYSWSAALLPVPPTGASSPAPPGMSFSASGMLSGTPTTAGNYSLGVTVTDNAQATATGTFSISIGSGLTITAASLPNGVVGTAYSAPAMAATGGVGGALTWSATGLPAGITLSAAGSFSGTPTVAGASSVTITVKDSQNNTASKSYTLTVTAPALTITLAGAVPSATVGSSFSVGFTAAGGVPPYSYSVSGLPVGSISTGTTGSGTVSGTPTAPGSLSVTLTVTDSAGAKANTTFTVNATLPAIPALSFTGLSTSMNPGSQSNVGVGITASYPTDVTVNLTLKFDGTDPAVQFSSGGASATLTIPAGQTASLTTVGVQTGTVAGNITITAQLLAGAVDITPSPAPTRAINIPATPPVISSITATRNSSGFAVAIAGYSSPLAMTTATFTFSGTNLATTSLSVPVGTIFTSWYQSSTAAQYGSNFLYTQPFITSNPQAVTSVTVTLANGTGTSAPANANLQ